LRTPARIIGALPAGPDTAAIGFLSQNRLQPFEYTGMQLLFS